MGWEACGDGFIKADVIRWTEAVWDSRHRKNGKARRIGERQITAEVIEDDGAWVRLLVRECVETARFTATKPIALFTVGTVIRRARNTIGRHGKAVRLLWSDEGARACLVEESRVPKE